MQSREFKNYKAEWEYKATIDNEDKKDKEQIEFKGIEVKFFTNNEFQYSKVKNSYHTENDQFMLLEWFEINNRTVFLFNDKHGVISIFDCYQGDLIHTTEDTDIFIYDYKKCLIIMSIFTSVAGFGKLFQ